jgi:hypothetical protein
LKRYRVEEIELNKVVSAHTIDANTPFEAAALASRRTVTLRRGEADWIKVTETDPSQGRNIRLPTEFEYRGIEKRT